MRTIEPNDSLTIDFHPSFYGSDYLSESKECFQKMLRETALRLKTIRHFQKIWNYNLKANQNQWIKSKSLNQLNIQPPDLFVLGGPSVDEGLAKKQISKKKHIWSADTALAPLVNQHIYPEVVFSIDAGFGSFEHYVYVTDEKKRKIKFVLDAFSFPKYYRLGLYVYTYANTNPLIQRINHKHPVLVNETGDVFGLMAASHQMLFPNEKLPGIVGRDIDNRSHQKKPQKTYHITHLRGSAYHTRRQYLMSRLNLPEEYFYRLSKRFKT